MEVPESSDHEKWQLEWDNYFDDIEHAINRMLDLANRAEREGLMKLDAALVLAAADLMLHCKACEKFLNQQTLNMSMELYKQNPLLKQLLEHQTKEQTNDQPRTDNTTD